MDKFYLYVWGVTEMQTAHVFTGCIVSPLVTPNRSHYNRYDDVYETRTSTNNTVNTWYRSFTLSIVTSQFSTGAFIVDG